MKKVTALLLAVITLLIVTACGKIYFDEEEYKEAVSESESEAAAESEKQEEEISENKSETEDELGKTTKGKQIVAKLVYGDMMQYEKVVFDKKGIAEYKLIYKYFFTDGYYDMVKGYGDVGSDKVIKTDDNLRLIVYKTKDILNLDYDTFLNVYQRKSEDICTII